MNRSRGAAIPAGLLAPAALGGAFLLLPLLALLTRMDWAALPATLVAPETRSALLLSLGTAAASTAICLVLGVPLAIVIARASGRLAALLRAIVTLPLVLPPLVGGLALLSLLGRGGVLGDALLSVGIRIPFTTLAVVLAQVFVALPFLVISVEGSLRQLDPQYAEAAETQGAGPFTILFRITLPLIGPGLAAGTILCFTRALGEFGATALFAGNAAGTTRTVPLAIYTAFNGAGVTQDTALALSLILIAVAVIALVLVRGRTAD
ncbi:molybdenum ABC transporter permease subunit [Leucobacter sp. OLJS4]|uniref:ABC transporter permease n=1 Tax=unclassified Leucobacter TaxID=2621730 RepID=UPI000C19FA0E|nr:MULTISPECIES: ABC transporter permease [unclassified Leucobacter]PII85297.1 molybdenum ABC transporter permease subunit [Leucobacter sp. OLCALW19]PII93077.1 molybdenum ABC transporter permease subunit [Leucobacter sp. OLAS13]PII95949.1 molybdenum ABC transporter permease subunit [Leucobacter sp. OLTLW20]PII99251.1 molybdenum ABC transporter permease subunit [Leucobacter sp. OLDS2]PIJ01252.1 molybdenum ABC transporter permease subunit [Leucobacter sp. OLIS6]